MIYNSIYIATLYMSFLGLGRTTWWVIVFLILALGVFIVLALVRIVNSALSNYFNIIIPQKIIRAINWFGCVAIILLLTWPFHIGPYLHGYLCEESAGKVINSTITTDGYIDNRALSVRYGLGTRNPEGISQFRTALKLMKQGRINFVELPFTNTKGGIWNPAYYRYSMQPTGSYLCEWYKDDSYNMGTYSLLRENHCLGREVDIEPESNIVVNDKKPTKNMDLLHFGRDNYTSITDTSTNELVASLKGCQQLALRITSRLSPSSKVLKCGAKGYSSNQDELLFEVFKDNMGEVASAGKQQRYDLREKTLLTSYDIGDYFVHKVKVSGGLPPGTNKSITKLSIRVEDSVKPAILLIESDEKISIWDFQTDFSSKIAMVLINQPGGYSTVHNWPSVGKVSFYPLDEKRLKILGLTKNPGFIQQIEGAVTYTHELEQRTSSIVLNNASMRYINEQLTDKKNNRGKTAIKRQRNIDSEIKVNIPKRSYSTEAKLHVIGVYEGVDEKNGDKPWWANCMTDPANPPSAQEMSKCHDKYARQHPAQEVKIRVSANSNPVILALMAYEPIQWVVEKDDGVKIEAVILAGYHEQRISGIGSAVPVDVYTYEHSDCNSCQIGNGYFYAYKRQDENFTRAMQHLKTITNRNPASFQGSYSGKAFVVIDSY